MERNTRFHSKINIPRTVLARSPSPKAISDNENSPLQIACTQESSDNIDVVWDWQSPQAKKSTRRCPKRLLPQSPKVPLKKHPSNNSVDLERLRLELQSLKNELAVPDHEESLQLSPVEEAEYKTFTDTPMDIPTQEVHEDEIFELIEDDLDEQLVACSQQVERKLKSSDTVNSPIKKNKFTFKKTSPKQRILANDSFDDLLKGMDVHKLIESSSPESDNIQTEVHMYTSNKQAIQTNSGKVEFYRTQSFEMANSMSTEIVQKKCTPEEIERKKKEALARLASKRNLDTSITPSQCTLQEIEEKRLQALAKVEARRQQEIIERKRQEALKRLEMKRQQKAVVVKSSLATRLK